MGSSIGISARSLAKRPVQEAIDQGKKAHEERIVFAVGKVKIRSSISQNLARTTSDHKLLRLVHSHGWPGPRRRSSFDRFLSQEDKPVSPI